MAATTIDWHVRNAVLPAALYGVEDSKELVRALAPPTQQVAPTISFVYACSGVEQHSAATGDRSNPLRLHRRRQRQ
jgi:EREBP-like factor